MSLAISSRKRLTAVVLPVLRKAGHIDVEAQLLDSQAELKSTDRPFLANDGFQRHYLFRGLTAQDPGGHKPFGAFQQVLL